MGMISRAPKILLFAASLAAASTMALATDLNLSCSGENWSLELEDKTAEFIFPSTTSMDVMLDSPAEGRDWPRALTLIGDRDSAVLILDQRTCEGAPYTAELLTQRGQTPIFLVGCCKVSE